MITFKKFVREGKEKTAVFSFGRMNPPTSGHGKLIKKVMSVAKKEKGVPMIYPSKTEDNKKNPLTYKTKVKVLQDVFARPGGNHADACDGRVRKALHSAV